MKKGQSTLWVILFIFIVIILIGVYIYTESKIKQYPQQNTQNTTQNIPTQDSSKQYPLYPDSRLTPGGVMSTNTTLICVTGYSTTVRDVPESEKKKVFAEYGIQYPAPNGMFEIDHSVSLSIGGSNEITNLWPQYYRKNASLIADAYDKDKLEKYLLKKVCKEGFPIEEAQREISTDWYYWYVHYGLNN